MKIIKIFISLIILCYFASATFLFVYQDDYLYQPTEDHSHDYSTRYFSNDGQRLSSIVLNPDKKNAILYFGGSGESMGFTANEFEDVFPDHSMYLINYRGYGGSTGNPGEQEFYSDALDVYDELSNVHADISVIGYSLGSGIATYLASKRLLSSIALVAPYDSMLSVAREHYPFYPMSILLKDRYDSISRVDDVNEQVLVVVAEEDLAVPYELSRQLIDAFPPEQIKVKVIRGADHNSLLVADDFYTALKKFMGNTLSVK